MPDRRGSRFALEVLFLVALAVGLAIASLEPLVIAGVMLVGWLLVAALEWAAWRDEPHYGSGLPPRYYVPTLNLPPARPLEQVAAGYPEAQRDEAPTWIASAALRAEVLGEWPMAKPAEADEDESEVSVEPEAEDDRWTRAELPVAPIGEQGDAKPEPLPVAAAPEPEPEPEEPEAETDPGLAPSPEERAVEVLPVRPTGTLARYSLDPLAEPPPKRRFGRSSEPDVPVLEVPARPASRRVLPARSSDE